MNKIFGFIVVSVFSMQAMAFEQLSSPPFTFMSCQAGDVDLKVKIQKYPAEANGSAIVYANGEALQGQWQWEAEPEGTRLTGHYHLYVQAKTENGQIQLRTLFDGFNGKLSGGWLEMPGLSEPVECKIDGPQAQNSCQTYPAGSCKSKRICCSCIDGVLTCA